MNRLLHSNLKVGISTLFSENGCQRQGRGVFGLFLMAFFAVFLSGKAWADEPLVDGGVYLIQCKNWNGYYLFPSSGNMKVANSLDKNRYWVAQKVVKDGETFYTFRNYDEAYLGVGTNSSSKGIYLEADLTLPADENAIKHGNFNSTNDAFLFKLVARNNSYAVIPYEQRDTRYSWFLDANNKTLGLKEYDGVGNKGLWNFVRVESTFALSDLSISGQTPITEGNTFYEYTRGSSQCWLFFGSNRYSILADNGSTNYTAYELDYEGTLPSGITCTPSADNSKWIISVGNLPGSAATITLKCTVTRHQAGQEIIEKVYSYPVIIGQPHSISSLSEITDSNGCYFLDSDIEDVSGHTTIQNFTGFFDGQHHTIKGLDAPIFGTMTNAVVRNVNLEEVAISGTRDTDNTGSVANVANGASRIYNVGILSGSVGGSGNTGGLVGLLDGTARVINCYSFANITSGGGQTGTYVGGLVGNNSQTSTQLDIKTIVVNCMFYGDIDTIQCSRFAPVYGNNAIKNDAIDGINPYCFFSEKDGTFARKYLRTGYDINNYNRSWSVKEEYLTRYEYYRSILNSNRQLMAWWVTGNSADTALISKWVLDPSIAPYPILKKWGKYLSVINPDPDKYWDEMAGVWVQRANAASYQGKILGTLSITVNPGNHAPSSVNSTIITRNITDMDTLHFDYGYCKVQLPYYNELFGNPSSNDHNTRYGGNYKDYVVTGWKVTAVSTDGSVTDYNSFVANWESGYNFADRHCTDKDLYATSGRVFAQGGYYYVPEGVTAITIEAYWGKAVYLHNAGHYLDRVKMTNYEPDGNVKLGEPFEPAGKLPQTFQGQTVFTDWRAAVKEGLTGVTATNLPDLTVYDQAIVLVGNFQLRNENGAVGTDISGLGSNKYRPYTIMSIDLDLDNEPDYCFEFQFRNLWDRRRIQPIRFDFLTVPELGMAVRHNEQQNTIGIFVPEGHFEITETSYMHTTQFEYDANISKQEAPVILNGGHFEQIVVRRGVNNKTSYFIMGGHFRMLRFTPGAHTTPDNTIRTRHCAVNAIGGEYPEFYLSGIYKPDQPVNPDNPHCYTNGGRFGIIAGAGYEAIDGNITFKIDHSIIDEFYGGGINGAKPVTGRIDVTIDHSIVGKYCGGPKVGEMTSGMTVTTHATETTFTMFYGGGNGGTSYYRKQGYDGNDYNIPPSDSAGWANFGGAQGYTNYDRFNPLNTRTGSSPLVAVYNATLGYHALYEFECFVSSNGLAEKPTLRTYTHWAQFGKTSTGNVTNELNMCIIKKNFYGGGNLGNVNGTVTSTLTDCTIMGNVYGGGFSSKIEPFRIHDKGQTHFPYIDKSGVMQDGLNGLNSLEYIDREYTWCYKNASGQMFPQGVVIPSWANTSTGRNATFEYPEGSNKWYVLTKESLEGLGEVSESVTLTLKGTTTVGTEGDNTTGNVYGGGDESTVVGNTVVKLHDGTHVLGNVFGGGNKGKVDGNSSVTIEPEPQNP